MGIVIAARELGKMESNEVFCGAVEEEEGGEKLVEIIKVWITIEEELKAGEVIVLKNTTIEIGRYDRYWYSASIAYSAPIDVTAAFPTVTQGVVAGLRPNWYNLFQIGDLEEDFNVMDQPDDLTLVQRADRWRCGGP
ncbi:hypothetical protein L249_4470 [Ophiocordyceps polyrhachis-furcata BCC 54312]|uniref:Uncharacterized protein n=1 Tax=Ophiocordyceps polyrhachis-furcata BCC 54312 TaxID=1330021 RepID=A0A367L7R8_9HYPO|nr:hypothetical protein L249_4470 [Ophiocordyceps polyrhachis-furcata BCC 54312]